MILLLFADFCPIYDKYVEIRKILKHFGWHLAAQLLRLRRNKQHPGFAENDAVIIRHSHTTQQ